MKSFELHFRNNMYIQDAANAKAAVRKFKRLINEDIREQLAPGPEITGEITIAVREFVAGNPADWKNITA